MKTAIFGSRGYLGRQLSYYLRQKGVAVSEYDLPECDVLDDDFWRNFNPSDFHSILFFSGLTGTQKSFDDVERFLLVNELGLLKLLKRLVPLGEKAPRIIFPSSRLVYKGSEALLAENAEKETRTPYAVNKLACEGYLSAYHVRYGISYAVVRICVPYGSLIDSAYSYGTVGFFESQAKTGENIRLYGGGNVRRTFTHVQLICQTVDRLLSSKSCGVFNVGGEDRSLYEIAKLIADNYGVSVESAPWPEEAELLESGSTVFDSSRVQAL